MKKLIYRISVVTSIAAVAAASAYIGYQIKRLNDHIEFIREHVPLSSLNF